MVASQFSLPLSRRAVVRLGGGGVAALASTRSATAAFQSKPAATFVLVHGAWAGAWIWNKVASLLRAAGHDVHITTATGMGDRIHLADPGIDLDVYITDVVNLLEYEDLRDVTLVGWSFGGMTITGVADQVPERLARVVYLDASMPANGQNQYEADFSSEEARREALAADMAAGNAADLTGFLPVTSGVEEWIRGSLADSAVAEWVLSKLVPQPLLTFLQPVRLGNPAAAALPRAYVLCTADKDLQMDPQTDPHVLAAEQVRSNPNWRVVELADNHLAPINAPQATADALLALI